MPRIEAVLAARAEALGVETARICTGEFENSAEDISVQAGGRLFEGAGLRVRTQRTAWCAKRRALPLPAPSQNLPAIPFVELALERAHHPRACRGGAAQGLGNRCFGGYAGAYHDVDRPCLHGARAPNVAERARYLRVADVLKPVQSLCCTNGF